MAQRLTKDNFESTISSLQNLVLVDFYSDTCIPCKRLNPILSQIEEELNGDISVFKVNTNFDVEIAEKYDVLSTPTLVLFENGVELDKKSGFQPKEVILDWISENK